LIRRLFVTVRDERWHEVAPEEWFSEFDVLSQTVSISARHVSDLVDFAWQGTLRMAADARELTFEFTGKVLRDMNVCRLGLVILHPVEWMIGADIYAEDTKLEPAVHLSNAIAPQPIVDGLPAAMTEPFSRLRVENAGLGKLEFRFEGDSFELEDQRNWGDASFKTYCTPLRLGFPRSVVSGRSISHRVQVNFDPSATYGSPRRARLNSQAPQIHGQFPKIGRQWLHPDTKCDEAAPRWSHVQFRIAEYDSLAELTKFLVLIPSSTGLEVAIEPQQDPAALRAILSRLSEHKQRIQRLLVFGSVTKEFRTFDAPVLAATHGYFVEFNRDTPLADSLSGIAFPLTATVHSNDPDTVVDNVAAIRDIANTARKLLHNPCIALAPLAFYHPKPQSLRKFPALLARPWLVACAIETALAGVTSITLDDDVIRELSKHAEPSKEVSLSVLVECSDTKIAPVDSELPAGAHAVVLDTAGGGAKRLLASNLSSGMQKLTVSETEIELPAYGTRLIDLVG
jgi:hypothetical protein